MPDFLSELENKKRKQELDEQKRLAEVKQARAEAKKRDPCHIGYTKNKLEADSLFQRIADYAARVNEIGDFRLKTKSFGGSCNLSAPGREFSAFRQDERPEREIRFYLHYDELRVWSVWFDFSKDHQGDFNSNDFALPLHHVSTEQISAWVKWVATGESPSQ